MKLLRIDKFLADSTALSRREIRSLARAGKILCGGTPLRDPGAKVPADAVLTVKGKEVSYCEFIYLMLNKPQGYLSATEDARDPVVTALVPPELQHYAPFPVGRLDKDTEGLLLLTNDGQFDHALTSPRREISKRYFAILDRPAVPEDVAAFAAGMEFAEFMAKPAELEILEDPHQIYVTISEGKYHQVKRMCERVGKSVIFLQRVAIGGLRLDPRLPIGGCRQLTADDFARLGVLPDSQRGESD